MIDRIDSHTADVRPGPLNTRLLIRPVLHTDITLGRDPHAISR